MSAFRLLAIETSSAIGSIALGIGDQIAERSIATPREQTPRILSIIDELLTEAGLKLQDLDALVFGRGPGSFTGLRVAAAVVQGLSFSAGPPIVSVSSLAALAERAAGRHDWGAGDRLKLTAGADDGSAPANGAKPATGQVLCCIDARMNEVYWASFRCGQGQNEVESEERIGTAESVVAPDSPFVAVGDGLAAYPAALASVIERAEAVDPSLVPGARDLLTLAKADVQAKRFVSVEAALPAYLRESDAWRKA
jgi:tRNA threonylcarbamoyladenosine biosynthesis protein TsaB